MEKGKGVSVFLHSNMQAFRVYKNLTQSELAKETGLTLYLVSAYEQERTKKHSFVNVHRLAQFFNVPINSLIFCDLKEVGGVQMVKAANDFELKNK